jgi:hypothetical protein
MRVAGLAATALSGGVLARPALAQSSLTDPRINDLATLPTTASPVHIPGHGWFETALSKGDADGVVRVAASDGGQWQRIDFAGALRPSWFTQPEDGPDDAPAIQRACNHAARFGPFAIDLGNTRYRCLTPLAIDPTRMALRGVGAVLDFSTRTEPSLSAPAATLDDIIPELGWQRKDGALTREVGESSTLNHFLPLPEEGRYRVTIVIAALSGNSDFPALDVVIFGANRTRLGGITAIAPGRYDFEIEGPQPAARLGIETGARVQIDSLTITAQGRRECILVGAGEASPQYGHKWIEGIEIVGPGAGTALHGLRFETNAEARSSRLEMRDVTVRGFHTGLVFSHRAYLIRATGLRCACEIGLHFLGGLRDAGELISVYGSVIDGGRIAILNNDAELALFGTAIDFVDQVFVGSGRLTLHGCHLEINRPKAADKPLIDLGQGNVAQIGGSFGVTGANFEAGNLCTYIYELRSPAATASMREVSTYNLRSQSGALAGGPGRLDTALMRGRRPRHMAPIVQFNAARNLLGPLPLDLRTSDGPIGVFERFPTDVTTFKVSPAFRHIWLFGRAHPGAELGVAFRVRSETPGTIYATLQAFDGQARTAIGDAAWPIAVTADWQRYLDNTGDTHPASALDGRMPEGYGEVALMLDLSELKGTVEVADFFICAV